ncbi:MAG: MATE family efflux transporter, partial [Lachnospiraceae bacterium]|nr:MATE family efflux transporter [Lachnospiraceae bacterium]
MKIQLSEHFSYRKLLQFTLPSIIMMVFTSIYGVVDGFFVSNYAGKTQFAAVNLIMPFLMILGTIGFMFGTGGSALVSKTMGEGKREKAKQIFSQLIYASILLGILFSVAGILFLRPVSRALGAEGEMLEYCVLYGRIILCALTAFILQNEFQSFFVAAEKPHLGLFVTVIAGVANMILDALFVAVFKWGIVGAALATAISQILGGILPLLYFFKPNGSALRLIKSKFEIKVLLRACTNGSSEMMSNLSMSLVSMLYNMQLMKFAGENGVAAYGVLMYVNFIFLAIFIGIGVG